MDFRIIKTVISREYSTRVKKKSFLVTFVDENDIFTNTHHRVHVVGIDYSCDIVFLGDTV